MSISSNMSLPIPDVGSTAGPTYATDVNTSLTLIDQHDHSTGKGVQITPSGINISSSLAFNNNFATTVAGLTLTAQNSTPGVGTVYESGNDLYFVDGVGNNVRITQNGGIAGSPGSISNLSSPASAAYVSVSSTFVWQSNTGIAANLDCASVLLRNISPNSTYALTLSPPAALAANYSLTLPSVPGSASFLTIDTSGNITGSIATTQGIAKTNLAALGQQVSSNINESSFSNLVGSPKTLGAVTITTTGRPVFIGLQHDGTLTGVIAVASDGSSLNAVTGTVYVVRDSTTVSTQQFTNRGSASTLLLISLPLTSFWHIDTGAAAGSHTYTFYAYVSGATVQMSVTQAKIIAYEL